MVGVVGRGGVVAGVVSKRPRPTWPWFSPIGSVSTRRRGGGQLSRRGAWYRAAAPRDEPLILPQRDVGAKLHQPTLEASRQIAAAPLELCCKVERVGTWQRRSPWRWVSSMLVLLPACLDELPAPVEPRCTTSAQCLGAACERGRCEIAELVATSTRPFAVLVDESSIYWSERGTGFGVGVTDGAVHRANHDGTNPQALVEGLSFPWFLAVDTDHLYFSTRNDQQVFRVQRNGAAQGRSLATLSGKPMGIAIDDNFVFVATSAEAVTPSAGTAAVYRIEKIGGTPVLLVEEEAGANPFALTVGDDFVYWANWGDGTVRRIEKTANGAPASEVLATDQPEAYGLLVIEGTVYWTVDDAGQGRVLAKFERESAPRRLAAYPLGARFLAADGDDLLWSTNGGPILRINRFDADQEPQVIVEAQQDAYFVSARDSTVYWTDVGGQAVRARSF